MPSLDQEDTLLLPRPPSLVNARIHRLTQTADGLFARHQIVGTGSCHWHLNAVTEEDAQRVAAVTLLPGSVPVTVFGLADGLFVGGAIRPVVFGGFQRETDKRPTPRNLVEWIADTATAGDLIRYGQIGCDKGTVLDGDVFAEQLAKRAHFLVQNGKMEPDVIRIVSRYVAQFARTYGAQTDYIHRTMMDDAAIPDALICTDAPLGQVIHGDLIWARAAVRRLAKLLPV